MKISELDKYASILKDYKTTCMCGHRMLIPYHIDKMICSWYGNYVYRNKRVEFKDKLKREMKKNEKIRRNKKNTESNN